MFSARHFFSSQVFKSTSNVLNSDVKYCKILHMALKKGKNYSVA